MQQKLVMTYPQLWALLYRIWRPQVHRYILNVLGKGVGFSLLCSFDRVLLFVVVIL